MNNNLWSWVREYVCEYACKTIIGNKTTMILDAKKYLEYKSRSKWAQCKISFFFFFERRYIKMGSDF